MALITTVLLAPGLAAARPAAGQAGRLYYSTDTLSLDYDNGAAWVAYAGGAAHAILSATHSDADPQAVTRGSIIYGDVTPEWTELVVGAAGRVLTVNAGGTEPEWAVGGGGGGLDGADYYGRNLIKNSPGQIVTDGAEPQWWDESSGNATLTDEDTAGEAPPDIHERCFKCVTIANNEYGEQTFTLADEEVLDAGVTVVSLGCWVYCATGAKASVGIFGTNLTLQESAQAGAGAWEWLTIENITLNAADASIEVRLIVDTDTAWFTMPMFSVGPTAQPWASRTMKYVPVNAGGSVLLNVTVGTTAWTDIDCTALSDPLATLQYAQGRVQEPNGVVGSFLGINHSDDIIADTEFGFVATQVVGAGPIRNTINIVVMCDDSQIIRYDIVESDADNDVTAIMLLGAYWMWA